MIYLAHRVTMDQAKSYLVAGVREHVGYTPEIKIE